MNECDYYRSLEEQYDEKITEKLSDEEIEDLWRLNEYSISDETIKEIYEKLEL